MVPVEEAPLKIIRLVRIPQHISSPSSQEIVHPQEMATISVWDVILARGRILFIVLQQQLKNRSTMLAHTQMTGSVWLLLALP